MTAYGHEAVHTNVSKDGWVNRFIANFFCESLGFNVCNWVEEHCLQHHILTGRLGHDPDECLPLIRLNKDSAYNLLYGSLNSIIHTVASLLVVPGNILDRIIWTARTVLESSGVIQDVPHVDPPELVNAKDQKAKDAELINPNNPGMIKHSYWDGDILSVTLRAVFWQSYLNGLPFILYVFGWTACASVVEPFFICFVSTSLYGSLALHLFHASHITELSPGEFVSGMDWGEAQLRESVNYTDNSPLYFCLTGGLSNQIEHHLFPTVSMIFGDSISPIVKQTAKEFGLPYKCEPSAFSAVRKSLYYVAKLGMEPAKL
jgi:linoleoyl-CoA desaturase